MIVGKHHLNQDICKPLKPLHQIHPGKIILAVSEPINNQAPTKLTIFKNRESKHTNQSAHDFLLCLILVEENENVWPITPKCRAIHAITRKQVPPTIGFLGNFGNKLYVEYVHPQSLFLFKILIAHRFVERKRDKTLYTPTKAFPTLKKQGSEDFRGSSLSNNWGP